MKEFITRHSKRTRLKLAIVAVCVVISFALLVVQAFFVHEPRYDVIAPLAGAVCGLQYLRPRGRS